MNEKMEESLFNSFLKYSVIKCEQVKDIYPIFYTSTLLLSLNRTIFLTLLVYLNSFSSGINSSSNILRHARFISCGYLNGFASGCLALYPS